MFFYLSWNKLHNSLNKNYHLSIKELNKTLKMTILLLRIIKINNLYSHNLKINGTKLLLALIKKKVLTAEIKNLIICKD